MYASQFNYDMAEPAHDYALDEAQERVADLLDSGDAKTAKAFAEFAYERIGHDAVVAAMAALFRVSDSKWRTLRDRLDDVVGEPLDCLRICMDNECRSRFIAERAGGEA